MSVVRLGIVHFAYYTERENNERCALWYFDVRRARGKTRVSHKRRIVRVRARVCLVATPWNLFGRVYTRTFLTYTRKCTHTAGASPSFLHGTPNRSVRRSSEIQSLAPASRTIFRSPFAFFFLSFSTPCKTTMQNKNHGQLNIIKAVAVEYNLYIQSDFRHSTLGAWWKNRVHCLCIAVLDRIAISVCGWRVKRQACTCPVRRRLTFDSPPCASYCGPSYRIRPSPRRPTPGTALISYRLKRETIYFKRLSTRVRSSYVTRERLGIV